MIGTELLKRKYDNGDYLEYNDDYNFDSNGNVELQYHLTRIIYIDYDHSVVIIKDIANGMYQYHFLKNIHIKLPPSTPENTIKPRSNPLASAPPKLNQT